MAKQAKRIYNKWKQEDMNEALTKLSEGVIGSNETHRKYKILKPTLLCHFKGLSKQVKSGRPKDLTEHMEKELVANILNLESNYFGPTARDLRKLPYHLAERYRFPYRFNKDKEIAGKNGIITS
uniref:SJCHGC02966 protein n=1 Tax=Schistosoma japonicum TaxID=6182 RepID=Q5DI66_SCHJA|nr:SJCHGC02966 protein [Schistosoma japonicum]